MIWPDVECPDCHAEPGHPCRTLIARHGAGRSHAARDNAATARTRALAEIGGGGISVNRARRQLRERAGLETGARP